MKNKIIKKSIAITMLVSLFMSLISNIVLAKSVGESALIQDRGKCELHLQYWKASANIWSYVTTTYVTYNENGVEYPAYCLNQDLHGVGEQDDYEVDLTQALDNIVVWRTIINGYPYKTPEELGVYDKYDAFVATKQAVYCALYGWDAASRYRGGDERGTRIANAIVNMVNAGRNGTETPYSAGFSISPVGNLVQDGDYYTQEMNFNCGTSTRNYIITATNGLPNGSKITDVNNNETNYFDGTSRFKIRIPKNSMNNDINVIISAQASAKIYPVFYGKTRIDGTQNYAITCDPYGDITGYGTFNLKTNTGRLQVNKTDNETKEPIANVTFQLAKKDGTIIATTKTNENGVATFGELYQGDYVLKETESNPNYILNNVDMDVNVEYNKTTNKAVENEHKKGNVKIYKVDKDNNKVVLGNVQFDLFSHELNKVIGTYTTDVNGEIYIENLRTGNYSVIEKNTNKWYNLADNVDIEVKWNETNNVTIENELKKGQIKVIKVDKNNHEVKLEGVKFNVLDEKGNVLETITTDKNGIAVTKKYVVRDFQKLVLQETQTLKNYVLNDKPQTIELKENEITNITFENKEIEGNIELTKTDVENKEKLSNCEFKVYKDINENGKLDENDIFVDTLKEVETGIYRKDNLKYGKYIISETKAKDGYVIAKEITFEITEDGVTKKISLKDKKVEMSKVDISGKEIEGAKIQVFDKDNKVVDEWISTKDAHKIKNLVEGQKYKLHEEIAADGFVKATDIDFEVSYEKKDQHIEMIDKVVTMSKKDIAGDEVEGAELKVVDENENIVDSWTSTKESHNISGLEEGKKYTLYEDFAPEGLVISNEIEFEVTKEKKDQFVEMIDKRVQISKQDIAGNEIEGATLIVTNTKTKQIIDKWVSGKEPHFVNNLIEGQEYNLHEEISADGFVKATDIQFEVSYDKETQKIVMVDKVVKIIKTDLVTSEEIEGAELKVVDEDNNIIDEWTSSKEPHIVNGLEENKKYKLIEVTAPYGFEQAEEIEFIVSEDKETQIVEMKDKPILNDITLVKVDADTKERILDNFTFGLYTDNECTKLMQQADSNVETGTITFNDLRYGIFYVKELSAPKGYEKSEKVVKVEINDKGIFIDDNEIEQDENEVYSFEFEDKLIEVPNTGDTRKIDKLIGIVGMSFATLMAIFIKFILKRRNKKIQ